MLGDSSVFSVAKSHQEILVDPNFRCPEPSSLSYLSTSSNILSLVWSKGEPWRNMTSETKSLIKQNKAWTTEESSMLRSCGPGKIGIPPGLWHAVVPQLFTKAQWVCRCSNRSWKPSTSIQNLLSLLSQLQKYIYEVAAHKPHFQILLAPSTRSQHFLTPAMDCFQVFIAAIALT